LLRENLCGTCDFGQGAYDGVGFSFQELFWVCAKFFTNEMLTPCDGAQLLL
jgi:hypothetical protein